MRNFDTLRELISSIDMSSYDDNIRTWARFELNHLELHHIDNYLLNLYKQNIKVDNNKNNSTLAYLIGITDIPPSRRITTVGGGFPD